MLFFSWYGINFKTYDNDSTALNFMQIENELEEDIPLLFVMFLFNTADDAAFDDVALVDGTINYKKKQRNSMTYVMLPKDFI